MLFSRENTTGRMKRGIALLCALLMCLSMLCACGKDQTQEGGDNTGAASSAAQSGKQGGSEESSQQAEVTDIYELPLFDELPENYAEITPAFWKAESPNGGVLYLFGSIHIADKTAYRMPQQIMDAYLASSALAVEVDTLAMKEDEERMKALEALTTYPDGDNLQNHIDPLIYDQIVEFLKSNSDDPEILSRLKNRRPCIWLTELGAVDEDAAGLSADYGIDDHFMKLAHAQGKEIIEIESAESQYNALNSLSDRAYDVLLGGSVMPSESLGKDVKQLYEQWKAGKIEASTDSEVDEVSAEEDPFGYTEALAEYNRIIYTDRNAIMAKAAKSYLDDGKKVFFVVGAEHMLGSTGIVESLKADGYTVERIG